MINFSVFAFEGFYVHIYEYKKTDIRQTDRDTETDGRKDRPYTVS